MIIISDIHGCYWTMVRLLRTISQQYPEEGELVLLGDLIDRGPHSKQVVEFAMNHKIPVVMGNHELLALWALTLGDKDGKAREAWYMNGGEATMKSFGGRIPNRVVRWMADLPLSMDRGKLLLSHTGHVPADCLETSLWARGMAFPDDGRFRVFGHTPQSEPLITEKYACIDTGAAYRKQGFGKMTAMIWPSKEIVQQEYNETELVIGYAWRNGKYYEAST